MESVVRKARRFGVVHLIAGIRFSTKKRKKKAWSGARAVLQAWMSFYPIL